MGRSSFIGIVATLLTLSCSARVDFDSSQEAIIGGRASTPGEFPTTGVLLVSAFQDGMPAGGGMLCTGTLIAPDVVLTAGHCAGDLGAPPEFDLEFSFSFHEDVADFGVNDLDLPPLTTAISVLVPHPQYGTVSPGRGLGNYFDVGLAFLASPVSGRAPAVIADAQDAIFMVAGTGVDIVGYGRTEPDGFEGGVKQQAQSLINEIDAWEMQIGDLPPVPQKCHGDSGGPTYLNVLDGRVPSRRLIGVTSRAYDEADCFKGGVDMRADSFREWIEDEMLDACTRGDRVASICAIFPGLRQPIPIDGRDAGRPDRRPPPPPDAGQPPRDVGFPDRGQPDTGKTIPPPPPPPPPVDAGPPPGLLQTAEPVACQGTRTGATHRSILLLLGVMAGMIRRRARKR